MDNESLNWFQFAKCLVDAGNKVLRQYLYFHASTCSLSDYHDIWQNKVKDRCQSDDLKVLWTSFNQQSKALDVTSQQIVQPLLSKWKCSIQGPPMAIRQQLSLEESWKMDLQDTISKNATQQNTLSKLSNQIQNLVTEHSLLLTSIRNWTKDFIHLCYTNQLDLLHWIEQHNEKTSSFLLTLLQKLDVIIRQGPEDLNNALQTCQQDEGNSSNELKTNLQTSFISWQSKIDTVIDSWATRIPNCINQKILQNLLADMRNYLPGVHKTCQVNVNDICSKWHTNLQNKFTEWNHQLQQVGASAGDLQDLARKWHEELEAFPSVSELQTEEFFDSKRTDLQSLKKRHTLTEAQWLLMFPSKGSINLQAFDITLSSTLLRNICSVFPPELGWSGEILDTDHSMGADLLRLKNDRNDYVGHIPHLALPKSDFERIWERLGTILYRLSFPLGNKFCKEIQRKIAELRTCSFDDRAEMKLQLELLNWYKSDSGQMQEKLESFRQELEQKVQDLTHQNVVILSEIQHLNTQIENMSKGTVQQLKEINQRVERMEECISGQSVNRIKQNERIGFMKDKITMHSDDKKDVHVQTRAYNHAIDTLLKHGHLVLHGKPGDGKTHTALSLIADLMKRKPEMQPVQVYDAKEWEELVNMKQPLIVFMDDVLGKYELSETDLGQWEKISELICPNICNSSIFLIVCFNNQIALKVKDFSGTNDNAFSRMFDSNVVNISDAKYCLTKEEKTEMLMKYATKHLKQADRYMIDEVAEMQHVIGFPQNCKIWSCGQNLTLKKVCENNRFLVQWVQAISKKSPQNYMFLVLLMLSGGLLSMDNIKELRCKIKTISELCGVRGKFSIGQFKDIGRSLCSTFVEYDIKTNTFRFQHDSIESAVFYSFGNDYPGITLQLCSLQALTKMCCLRNKGNKFDDESFLDFKIILHDDKYFKVIGERFSEVLKSKNSKLFQCIAEAFVWQSTQFSNYFLETLTSLDVVTFLFKKDLDEQSLLVYFIYTKNTLIVKEIVKKDFQI